MVLISTIQLPLEHKSNQRQCIKSEDDSVSIKLIYILKKKAEGQIWPIDHSLLSRSGCIGKITIFTKTIEHHFPNYHQGDLKGERTPKCPSFSA